MEKLEIKIGETFIYKSKYGGIVIDTIADFNLRYTMDLETGVMLRTPSIKSSRGIWYELSEIQIVERILSKKEIEVYYGIIQYAQSKKNIQQTIIQEHIDDFKNKKT